MNYVFYFVCTVFIRSTEVQYTISKMNGCQVPFPVLQMQYLHLNDLLIVTLKKVQELNSSTNTVHIHFGMLTHVTILMYFVEAE